jgi:hypothetical protein
MLHNLATVGALLASLVLPAGQSPAALATAPEHVKVDLVTASGSGCPAGTTQVAASPDREAFTVTYSDYIARAGGTVDPVQARKNCQLNVLVHVPNGFTYAVAKVDYRGYANLAKGATAIQRANYYFQGMPETAQTTHFFRGEFNDDWQRSDSVPTASWVWSPCGMSRNMNVNTELRVSPGPGNKSTSFITMDSTDGSFQTIYHLTWAQCPR